MSVKIGQLGDHYDPTIDPRFSKVGKQVCKDTGPLTKARMVTSRSRPLLALSGHSNDTSECPLLGVKQTSRFALHMSAFDPKRTSRGLAANDPKTVFGQIPEKYFVDSSP